MPAQGRSLEVAAMLKALKKLFDDSPADDPQPQEAQASLAAATLLQELTRVDQSASPEEQLAATRALMDLFGMGEADATDLLAQGAARARQLTSYFKPVACLKRAMAPERRVRFVEHLWRVAYADSRLDPYEDHFVRKIAHLLYVPNTQCMVARSHARSGIRLATQ
jgi:uncharacterized tellurite resistance protein B-like protein